MCYKLEYNYKGKVDVEIVLYDDLGNVSKYKEIYTSLKEKNYFEGKIRKITFFKEDIVDVIFIPVKSDISLDQWRNLIASASRICLDMNYNIVKFSLENILEQLSFNIDMNRLITEIFILAQYRFVKCKSQYKQEELVLCFDSSSELIMKSINEGFVLAKGTIIARNLTNMPSNLQSPMELLEEVKSIFLDTKVKVRWINKSEMIKLGMTGLLSVSKGSINEPVLILLEYQTDLSMAKIGLIGKGITYDSGGLSLKGKKGMVTMHHDMAGAAAVIGALYSASIEGLQNNILGVLPVAENLIATDGYRPGDIITMMDGKTVQILSTDAEGRLVIADALHYAITEENVQEVIDIASLTGGAKMAYGPVASAYAIENINEESKVKLEQASDMSGEKIWQMPLFDDYKEMLKTEHADMTNTGDGSKMIGGAIFIKEFISQLPWIHLDIAGTCWSTTNSNYYSIGATGSGVRLLYHYFKK